MACEGIIIETTTLDEVIEVGVVGPQGATGATGAGVPTGGITGYVLAKATGADYDTEWIFNSGGSDLSNPPPIGDVTPNTGAFTTLSAVTGNFTTISGFQSLFTSTAIVVGTSLTAARAVRYAVSNYAGASFTIILPVSGSLNGDVAVFRSTNLLLAPVTIQYVSSPTNVTLATITQLDQQFSFIYNGTASEWSPIAVDTHTHPASAISDSTTAGRALLTAADAAAQRTSLGLGTAATSASGDFAAAVHSHGNLTSDGKVGSTAGLPLKTGTAGVVEAGAFGTSAGTFSEGNDSRITGAIQSTIVDAKGDLIVATAADTVARLPVGATNGHVLVVDSAEAGGMKWAAASGGGSTNLWIPASQWIPRTTNGCGVDSRETSTNLQNFDELLFDAGTDEFAQALVEMPSNYNNGTITARFYWTASSGSGAVIWGIQGRAFADDDALDAAAGTAQTVTDTLLAANDMHVSSASSATTLGGTPAANTPIQFQIYRDADAAGDTLGVDARLLGVEIIFS